MNSQNQDQITLTTQLTSKTLKFNLLAAYVFISVGILLILIGNSGEQDKHQIGWGALISLYGFLHLLVTRVRIWWNHK